MLHKLILLIGLLIAINSACQKTIIVAESKLKLGLMAEDFFLLGFAKGDKLIFNFEEENGKEIKEVEIIEMPGTSKFMETKTKKISNRVIKISNTGIYKFRFSNKSIMNRVCIYKIERIPASSETENFNSTVFTHTVNDTTYVSEEESYLDKTDTVITNYQDRITTVNNISATSGNKGMFNFTLPDNIVSWSYYLYTDEPGLNEYAEASKKNEPNSKMKNYNLLAAVALNKPVSIKTISKGPQIDFWIMEGENSDLFMKGAPFRYMKKGKAVNDFSQMDPRKGNLFFCFSNNTQQMIKVTVKITMIHVNEVLSVRTVKRITTTPRTEMYLKN